MLIPNSALLVQCRFLNQHRKLAWNFHVIARFHTTCVLWNLRLTWKIPAVRYNRSCLSHWEFFLFLLHMHSVTPMNAGADRNFPASLTLFGFWHTIEYNSEMQSSWIHKSCPLPHTRLNAWRTGHDARVGKFHVNLRFHPTSVGWNLRLTWNFPNSSHVIHASSAQFYCAVKPL